MRAGLTILVAVGTLAGTTTFVASVGVAPANAQATYPTYLCSNFCDGRDPALVAHGRIGETDMFDGRTVNLHFDDADDMAWASIDGGTPGDQVWMDRSFDGGYDWSPYGSKLGQTTIPAGDTGWRTLMYNLDQFSSLRSLEGVVRACGETGSTISCTPWARTTWNAANNQRAAATALMEFYDIGNGGGNPSLGGSQLFDHFTGVTSTNTAGDGFSWWMSANDLTAIIDNIRIANMASYQPVIGWIYAANRPAGAGGSTGDVFGDFKNHFIDDTGWWAMAWIDAYDLTGDSFYLTTAEDDANYMNSFWDSTCGGGVWWSDSKTYKNSIANELDLYVNAALHNLIPGDTTYLNQALNEWNWLDTTSGLLNSSFLFEDGEVPVSSGSTACTIGTHTQTFTYNQGVILEGLAELYKATGNMSYLNDGEALANASTTAPTLQVNGELAEPNDTAADTATSTDANAPMFKGAYIRGLMMLNSALASANSTTAGPFSCYLAKQSAVAYLNARNPADQYGYLWAGPWTTPDQPTSGQQGSALFLANAGPAFTSPSDPAVQSALTCSLTG